MMLPAQESEYEMESHHLGGVRNWECLIQEAGTNARETHSGTSYQRKLRR
jgi:hypothetical protein